MKPIIEQNDILEWAKTYDGPKFHALLCDPPYHLVSGNVEKRLKPQYRALWDELMGEWETEGDNNGQ